MRNVSTTVNHRFVEVKETDGPSRRVCDVRINMFYSNYPVKLLIPVIRLYYALVV